MQYFFSEQDYVDVGLYEDRLNEQSHIYMDLVDLSIYVQNQAYSAQTFHRLCLQYMNMFGTAGYNNLGKESIIHYLTTVERVPSYLFSKKNVKAQSLDKKFVLTPIYQMGYAQDFLPLYFKYVNCKARRDHVLPVVERNMKKDTTQGWFGNILTQIPFTAFPKINLRFNYANENLIDFPIEIKHMIQAPEDYVLVWGDFAQADARVAFNTLLKDEYTLPFVEEYPDDIYAGFANLVSNYSKQQIISRLEAAKTSAINIAKDKNCEPDFVNVVKLQKELDEFSVFDGFSSKAERDLYKVNCLRTMYGTRFDAIKESKDFITKFSAVLESCPKYKKYVDDITHRADFGLPLQVRCYMGHTELVPAYNGKMLKLTLPKCLNYPIQGGTSEIMIMFVNRLLDTFYEKGYTSDDIRVYYTRHDEPLFIMKRDLMKDSWIFRDFTDIRLDDWTPLRMDFNFGRKYSITDDDLMSEYDQSCQENSDKITPISSVPVSGGYSYYPLPKMLEIHFCHEQIEENKYIFCFYSSELNEYDIRLVESNLRFENLLYTVVRQHLHLIAEKEYRQVVIYNNFSLSFIDDLNNQHIPVIYFPRSSPDNLRAMLLIEEAKFKLFGIPSQNVVDNKEFLDSVKRLGIFAENRGDLSEDSA